MENVVAICNHEITKIAINKSNIDNTVKDTFHSKSFVNSKLFQQNKIALEEKEWYTDYILYESIKAQRKTQTTDAYSVLYPLTVDVLHTLLNSKRKYLPKLYKRLTTGWYYFFVESRDKSIAWTRFIIFQTNVYLIL